MKRPSLSNQPFCISRTKNAAWTHTSHTEHISKQSRSKKTSYPHPRPLLQAKMARDQQQPPDQEKFGKSCKNDPWKLKCPELNHCPVKLSKPPRVSCSVMGHGGFVFLDVWLQALKLRAGGTRATIGTSNTALDCF